MKYRLILAALLMFVVPSAPSQSVQAAPSGNVGGDWNASRKQAESLVAAHRPNDAAASMIKALQGMQKSAATDADPNARKLIVEDLPDIVTRLIVDRKDYNNAEILCQWAISACTARFGSASPLTALSYTPLVTVYSDPSNTTANREQRKQDTVARRARITAAMTPAQRQDSIELSITAAQRGYTQLQGQMNDLHEAAGRFDQSVQRLQDTLSRVKKN